jgi:DNA-binding LytR/AlgR family response regulator
MKAINCLVVDDEELARALLENYISRIPHLELVGKCKDPIEAMAVLREHLVDVIFLDIQMPELTGVEFLKTLTKKPAVIFTTAYPQYAVESYSFDAVDYLLKPFSFERFFQSINKLTDLLRLQTASANNQPQQLVVTENTTPDHILVKSEHKIHRMRFDDILFIQSMREYVAYYTPTGRILSLNSLKSLEEELPKDRFIRIHKSYIVAIHKIDVLEGNIIHIGKEKLPIGANYRDSVFGRVFK